MTSDDHAQAMDALAQCSEEDKTILARLSASWPPFDRDPEQAHLIALGLLCASADPEGDRVVLSEPGKVAARFASERPIPRLAYGRLAGTHVRLWGDLDDTGVHLSGIASTRLWRVHECLFDGTWREVLKRAAPNSEDLSKVALDIGIRIYNA